MSVVTIDNKSILCSSSPIRKNVEEPISLSTANNSIYTSLSQRQKLAAMDLMKIFGSTSPCINHIMSVEAGKMGVSNSQIHAAWDTFSGMPDMVNTLKGANRSALESLFWAYYCIVAVGKSAQAVQVLLGVYRDLGFSEQECVDFLERRTGIKLDEL